MAATLPTSVPSSSESEEQIQHRHQQRRQLILEYQFYANSLYSFQPLYKHVPLTEPVNQTRYWNHICTSRCVFHNYQTLYICTSSQNLHRCSETECNVLEAGTGHNVCPLTGNIYAFEFATLSYTEKQETGCDIHSSNTHSTVSISNNNNATTTTTTTTTSRTRSKHYKRANNAATNELRQRTIDAVRQQSHPYNNSIQLTTRKLDYVQDKRNETFRLQATAETLLTHLLPKPIDQSLLHQVKTLCMKLWRAIINTSAYVIHCFKYRFEYHILVVLGELNKARALQVNDKIVIPKQIKLVGKCSFIKRLNNKPLPVMMKNNLKSKGYTTARTLFRQCISECINEL